MSFFFSLNLTAQKWINDSNCDEQSYEILNEAITHLANIEQLTALGMAKAAKISDSGCECANLVIAAVSSSDANCKSCESLPHAPVNITPTGKPLLVRIVGTDILG